MFRLSQLTDRVERLDIAEEREELEALKAELDPALVADYLGRRERNHAVNRAAIKMASDGLFDFLFLSQDDASEFGIPAREQRVLRADIREYNVNDKVVVYPGADEVGLVLLARAACQLAGYTPPLLPAIWLQPRARKSSRSSRTVHLVRPFAARFTAPAV